jgi:hypothetical protein
MRIRLIVAQYKCHYPGEFMPNVVDAWDEYVLEDNDRGYQEALAKHEAMVPNGYEWVRELDVTVPDDVIEGLADVPQLTTLWKQVSS